MSTSADIATFRRIIWDYYKKHGRHDLAWRHTDDPYHVFISEVMLQQTQVPRVITKYEEFLKAFPTVQSLASAPLTELLAVWQGMGYNRRALFLQRAAQQIMSEHGGNVPQDTEQLVKLPGIGKHTAGSIAAFAFNTPTVFIETNIRRTFIHHFFNDRVGVSDEDLTPIVQAALPKGRAKDWYNALMDYGTHLAKTVPNPNRKSKHYTKQSNFETSLRKVRGEIIKALTARRGSVTVSKIKLLPFEHDRIQQALDALVREGFITKIKNSYRIT